MRKVLYLMGILNDNDIAWLSREGQRQSVPAGAVLIEQGLPTQWLYIVLAGRLAVRVADGVEIARLGQGEVLGEISFLDSRPPSASVVASRDSTVLALHRDTVAAKLESDSGFAARFYHSIGTLLADRLRETSGQLGYLQRSLSPSGMPEPNPAEELDDQWTENISYAASRFENLLRACDLA